MRKICSRTRENRFWNIHALEKKQKKVNDVFAEHDLNCCSNVPRTNVFGENRQRICLFPAKKEEEKMSRKKDWKKHKPKVGEKK